jgi:hypothetical protein
MATRKKKTAKKAASRASKGPRPLTREQRMINALIDVAADIHQIRLMLETTWRPPPPQPSVACIEQILIPGHYENPTAPAAVTAAAAPAATEGVGVAPTSAGVASEPSDAELLS